MTADYPIAGREYVSYTSFGIPNRDQQLSQIGEIDPMFWAGASKRYTTNPSPLVNLSFLLHWSLASRLLRRYGCKDLSETRAIVEFILPLVFSLLPLISGQDDGRLLPRRLWSTDSGPYVCTIVVNDKRSRYLVTQERVRERERLHLRAGGGYSTRKNRYCVFRKRRKSSGTTVFKLNMCTFILFVSPFLKPCLFEVCLLDFSFIFLRHVPFCFLLWGSIRGCGLTRCVWDISWIVVLYNRWWIY